MKNKQSYLYRSDFVKGLFDRMGNSYDRVSYMASFGFSDRWRKQCIAAFPPSTEQVSVLDLLSGMGETWPMIHKRYPCAALTALDFSETMLNNAKQKNKASEGRQVLILNQDFLHNQLTSGSFDYIFCVYGLKTFSALQWQVLGKEVSRVLKPGGKISFIEISCPPNKWLKCIYGVYLGWVVPFIGRLLLGSPIEYSMLWEYTKRFGNAREATRIFRQAGLEVVYQPFFFGCASGFKGYKP